MKEGWKYKKLGELGTFQRGGGFLKSDYVDNGFPCIHYGQIHTKFGVSVDRHLTSISKEKAHKSKIASKGDIIIAITSEDVEGSCKCTAWMGNYDVAVGAHTAIFKHNQNPLYISYVLRSKRFNEDKTKYAHGFKVVEIKPDDISKIAIPVAPISIQEYIVSELDLLSRVIEKHKAQLEELDKLAQSIFYDMFGDPVTNEKGWELKKLSEVSKEKLSYGSGASAIPYDGELRYIRITDIKDNGELNEDVVSPNQIDEKYILREGDILFARSGATVGKTYQHREKYGKCLYAGYLIRLVPNIEMVMPTYVFGYTKTSYYLEFVKNAQNAVAQPNINAKQYGDLLICVPPLSLQQEFAAKVEAIEAMKAKVRLSLKEAETLFNERMDYYFN